MKPGFGWLSKRPALAARTGPCRLNLGCGGRFHPDWVNLDFNAGAPGVIQHDLRTPLPFADDRCEAVYHSHVLEHFSRSFAPRFLAECHRVLAPGGILRVVVPDLETIARLYLASLDGALAGDAQAAARHEWMTLELLDQMVREESGGEMRKYWERQPMPAGAFVFERLGQEVRKFVEKSGAKSKPAAKAQPHHLPDARQVARFRERGEIHQWMYDRHSLGELLRQGGFSEVRRCAADESQIPQFNSYQLDLHSDGSIRKPDSLFMEARKPSGPST